eukprot:g29962.t1
MNHQVIASTTVTNLISSGHLPTPHHLHAGGPPAPTAHFYFLHKVHKQDCRGRPIVSACSCPTERISSYLDLVFSPLVQSLPAYIRDSSDTLCQFQNFQFAGSSSALFTMDVQSLYMSIPHQDGLRALHFFQEQRPELSPSTTSLLHLAKLVLTLNDFSFNSSHFFRVRGVARGTHMGPSYASLFVWYIQHSLFQSYSGPHPQLFLQYIDEIIGTASLSRPELKRFVDFTSSFYPALTFTWSISDPSLPLLHISVSLATNIHYKPTDSQSYVDCTSSRHASCKDTIRFSQLLRLCCICSDEANFNKGDSE